MTVFFSVFTSVFFEKPFLKADIPFAMVLLALFNFKMELTLGVLWDRLTIETEDIFFSWFSVERVITLSFGLLSSVLRDNLPALSSAAAM